ncbi:MAG TPA: hypothetical protein VF503_25470 [Sphingobium sp.]|uniref:hypothetical protein n=1 Tax=Sphingobium sp. TaxID=1912891 RepID=UPI002ED074E5
MISRLDLDIDVTDMLGLGEPARIAVTIVLPDPSDLSERPVICFAKPGGGYSRGYYTADLPGPARGAQADWHARRGWIFVAMDLIGTGGSSRHAPEKLSFAVVVGAALAAEEDILLRLANGMLTPDFPSVHRPVRIGIGQSMGGGLAIVQQGRHHCYDGVVTLGYSAVHSHPPSPPGAPPIVVPWIPRDELARTPGVVTNRQAVQRGLATGLDDGIWQALAWGFFHDDVPAEVVEANLSHFDALMFANDSGGQVPEDSAAWRTMSTLMQVTQASMTPGAVAAEAAAVTVPILCAMGERDIVPDPAGEPRAFKSATSIDIFICPRMGHMHNFASTRELLWQRIESFGTWCAVRKGVV